MAQIENLDRLLKKLEKLDNIDLDEVLNKACILVENDAKKYSLFLIQEYILASR